MRESVGHACCLLDRFKRTGGVVKDMICSFPSHPVCLCMGEEGKALRLWTKGFMAVSPFLLEHNVYCKTWGEYQSGMAFW